MQLVFVKVPQRGKSKPQKTLREDIFKYYLEELGYSRRMFTDILGLNHRIFTVGVMAYYTPEQMEKLRRKKIVKGNILGRMVKWEDKMANIEVFIPGFTKIFQDNIKDNPNAIMEVLVELNDKFYKAKHAMKPIKKYVNQSLKRSGGKRINLVSNGLEAKIKFILDELGFKYECQYKIKKYLYDFQVGKTLIEVDGRYHEKTKDRDDLKENIAKTHGFKILRISEEMVKRQPLKTRRCLQRLNP